MMAHQTAINVNSTENDISISLPPESVRKLSINEQMIANVNKEVDYEHMAVQISSGYKAYGKYEVLKNLNLNVPTGAIYGLLGPSGCGKTTILRCIVGRVGLDSGEISVLGKEPGARGHGIPGSLVGYMPQEITLYPEFNINETLNFFGMLHNMKKEFVEARKIFLMDFLNLPPKDKLVKNLSGGQKRRVSMAVALLQEPKLLILDEPTVGVDPLLRERIWTHLIDISKTSKTTIMITTHYIEEARKADRVGLMRNGKLLAEQSPDFLLECYNQPTLEDVFLKLCIRDQDKSSGTGLANPNYEIASEKTNSDSNSESKTSDGTTVSVVRKKRGFFRKTKEKFWKALRPPRMNNCVGLMYKDLIIMSRTIGFLFFQICIPILQISLFCLCIGLEPYDLNFGIVNNETIYNSSSQEGSIIFINELSNKTFKKQFMNWSEADKLTKMGELWGFIDLSENFTQDTLQKFNPFNPPNATFNGSNINLYLDSSNQQITLIIQARVLEAYQNFMKAIMGMLPFGVSPSLLDSPIIKHAIYGDIDPQFINFMAPGIMITIIFILTIGLTALMFVVEKKEGLLERTSVAGINTFELILSHISVKLIVMFFQTAVLLIIANLVFNVNMVGSIFLAGLLLLLQGFCGMSFGMLISAIVRDENEAMEAAVGSVFPAMLLSGIIWPVEGMPAWVKFLSNFSPLTHNAEAIRSVASRGWGFATWTTWYGIGTVVGWSLLFDLLALILFNSEE